MVVARDDIRERVRSVIADMAPQRPAAVTGELGLTSDLGFDSLGLLELAGLLEEELGLEVDDDEVDVVTVRDVEDYVLARLGGS
jgi:acyl carrier protein